MKTIIREMVETIKQLFAQKQQMQEPVVANYEVSGIVEQKTLKKKEELEKAGEKTGKSNKWSQSLTLQLKEYLNDNFDTKGQSARYPSVNVKGNNYRLVVVVKFTVKFVYIRFIGTHKEYDKIDCANI